MCASTDDVCACRAQAELRRPAVIDGTSLDAAVGDPLVVAATQRTPKTTVPGGLPASCGDHSGAHAARRGDLDCLLRMYAWVWVMWVSEVAAGVHMDSKHPAVVMRARICSHI